MGTFGRTLHPSFRSPTQANRANANSATPIHGSVQRNIWTPEAGPARNRVVDAASAPTATPAPKTRCSAYERKASSTARTPGSGTGWRRRTTPAGPDDGGQRHGKGEDHRSPGCTVPHRLRTPRRPDEGRDGHEAEGDRHRRRRQGAAREVVPCSPGHQGGGGVHMVAWQGDRQQYRQECAAEVPPPAVQPPARHPPANWKGGSWPLPGGIRRADTPTRSAERTCATNRCSIYSCSRRFASPTSGPW